MDIISLTILMVMLVFIVVITGTFNPFVAAALAVVIFLVGFIIFAIFKVLKIWKKRPAIGEILGKECEAYEDIEKGKIGFVIYGGELWRAVPENDVKKGEKLLIVGKDLWRLRVRRK